jgi:hypothetical protein
MTSPSITPGQAQENLRYLLVDTDGVASIGCQPITGIKALLGEHGTQRLYLELRLHMVAYIPDQGLLMPQLYPRNVVGSVLLGSLGAPQQPYAGPVAVVGWDVHVGWVGRGDAEAMTLTEGQADGLLALTSDIRRVLGMETGAPSVQSPDWARDVRLFADIVRTAAPRLTSYHHSEQHSDVATLLGMLHFG